jgi:8-oxo-dGTP pyrophosphatase MutT (NUDIX family)
MTEKDVAMAVLWLNGNVLIEERWIDTENSSQDTRYAFPGGKIEDGESKLEAIIREVEEETGVVLDPNDEDLIALDELESVPVKVYVFRKLLDPRVNVKDGIIICPPQDLIDYYERGKLMPYTRKYVEEEFLIPNGLIDN